MPTGASGRVEGGEQAYNAAALRVMREHGIAIDDLYVFVRSQPREVQLSRNVHFIPDGYASLARAVAISIEAALTPVSPHSLP